MPWPVHPNGLLGAQGDNDNYQISRSLRFNSADSAYLSRTPASSGNTQKFTYSAWVKIASTATSQYITLLAAGTGAQTNAGNDNLQLRGNGTGLQIGLLGQGGTGGNYAQFSAYHRDPSSWQHVIVSVDTTQATQANRCRAYFNGAEETSAVNNTFGSAYNFTYLNATAAHLIGRGNEVGGPYHTDAYLAEINFIDGQALTPSSFGETDAITGRWKAKAYSGTYGTNGFYLKFADNSSTAALGTDSSGNGNTWTTNNFSVTAGAGNDSLVDSPTNYGSDTGAGGTLRGGYATANSLDQSGCTFTNGLLDVAMAGNGLAVSSIGISYGKWYAEATLISSSFDMIGICQIDGTIASRQYSGANGWYYYFDGQKYNNGTGSLYGASYTTNDIIGIALDMNSGSLTFYKNGTTQGVAYSSGISGKTIAFALGRGASTLSNNITLNFGQRPFAYTAPTGFKALCTTNLTTPTIKKPSSYFDAVAYTGTGASNSISSLGFSPDLVWIKSRSNAYSHRLADAVRGAGKELYSDSTVDETTNDSNGYVSAFNSNGFTLGTGVGVNGSTLTYVAWAWDETPIAGFDIISYTGNGANRTISHTLGVAPKMVIVKARSTAGADQGWPVWHTSIANTTYLQLNSTSATATGTDYWNSTSPTSSVFSVGTNAAVNTSADTYIAYAFAEIEGFSKFGSYTGNASADGPFVWCGFRPRWVLVKRYDGGAESWILHDSTRDAYNVTTNGLRPNSSLQEVPQGGIDFVSNGFKIRTNLSDVNASGASMIFAAFAEAPFKYARAR